MKKEKEAQLLVDEYIKSGSLKSLEDFNKKIILLFDSLNAHAFARLSLSLFQILDKKLSELIKPPMNIVNTHLRIEPAMHLKEYEFFEQIRLIKKSDNLFDLINIYKIYCDSYRPKFFIDKLNAEFANIIDHFAKYYDLNGNISGCNIRINQLKKTILSIPYISDAVRGEAMEIIINAERENSFVRF